MPTFEPTLTLIPLDDGENSVATFNACNFATFDTYKFNLAATSQQGYPNTHALDTLIVDNTANNGVVTVTYRGISFGVPQYARQIFTLPINEVNVRVSGTVGTVNVIFTSSKKSLASDTVNQFLVTQNAGSIVNFTNVNYSAVTTGATLIPHDATIPLIGEGTEFMSVTHSPLLIGARLLVKANASFGSPSARVITGAIFLNGANPCLYAGAIDTQAAGQMETIQYEFVYTVLALGAHVFSFRAGPENIDTISFNGAGGIKWLGATINSSMSVMEFGV